MGSGPVRAGGAETGKGSGKPTGCDPVFVTGCTAKSPGSAPSLARGDQSQSARWWSQWEAGLCAHRERQNTVQMNSTSSRVASSPMPEKEKARRCGAGFSLVTSEEIRVTSNSLRGQYLPVGPGCLYRLCQQLLQRVSVAQPASTWPLLRGWRGQTMRNRAPPSSPRWTLTRPPCHSAIRWTMDRPRP